MSNQDTPSCKTCNGTKWVEDCRCSDFRHGGNCPDCNGSGEASIIDPLSPTHKKINDPQWIPTEQLVKAMADPNTQYGRIAGIDIEEASPDTADKVEVDTEQLVREIVAEAMTAPMKPGVDANRLVEIRDEAFGAIQTLISTEATKAYKQGYIDGGIATLTQSKGGL